MASTGYENLLNAAAPWSTTDGAALASSVSLTTISPTSPDLTLPANFLTPGSVFRITASGRFSTTGSPTLLIGAYWGGSGGVALATTGALTAASGVTNLAWRFQLEVTCRTVGSSGTVMAMGYAAGITAATAVALVPASAPVVASIDTTTAKALVLAAQWGTSSPSNTITCHQFLVESLD